MRLHSKFQFSKGNKGPRSPSGPCEPAVSISEINETAQTRHRALNVIRTINMRAYPLHENFPWDAEPCATELTGGDEVCKRYAIERVRRPQNLVL